MSELWQGTVAPEYFDLNLVSPAGGLDLTTVTAATIKVFLPGGTEATWTASLLNPTTTSLTLRHAFAATTEVPKAGILVAYGHLTVPGGFVDTDRTSKPVRGKYEVP